MAECIARAAHSGAPKGSRIQIFSDAISAMDQLNTNPPNLILLDILLSGPDGFNFLNELVSYSDTVKIPVIIITSLDLQSCNLSHYGVIQILQKETMVPQDIAAAVKQGLKSYAK